MPDYELSEKSPAASGQLHPRAFRYPIQTPIRYRASGQSEWNEGRTLNISRSGVLFHPDPHQAINPDTVLELNIIFPQEVTGGNNSLVVCLGPVVRREDAARAVAFQRYRFMHELA